MILNTNKKDVAEYENEFGIEDIFEGDVKRLVEIEDCSEFEMVDEASLRPPVPLYEVPIDEVFDEDEVYVEESDFSDSDEDLSEEETDKDEDTDTEIEVDD